MKWFKHQSTARNDERVASLEDRAGLEGYGFYFKMLEIVAEVIDQTDRHDVTYSLSRWGRQANVTSKKYLFLLQCCSDVGLMSFQREADNITVNIPNLLKYRDNHTKNLQVTSKQEKEVEIDKEEKKINKKPSALALLISHGVSESIAKDWLQIRAKKKQPLTETALKATIREAGQVGYTLEQAVTLCCERSWAGFRAEYLLNSQSSSQAPPANAEAAEADRRRRTTEAAGRKLFGDNYHPGEKEVHGEPL